MDDDPSYEFDEDKHVLCPFCLGDQTQCDGLDEAACAYPCPPCKGKGYVNADTTSE